MPRKLTNKVPKLQKDVPPPSEQETAIAHYEHLMMSVGWNMLTNAIQHEIDAIEYVILTKRDLVTGASMPEQLLDLMRAKREIFTEVIGKPAALVAQLRQKPAAVMPEYDPFFQTVKEIGRKEEAEERSSRTLRM